MAGDNDYVPNILKADPPSCDVKVSGYTPVNRMSLEDGVIHVRALEEAGAVKGKKQTEDMCQQLSL